LLVPFGDLQRGLMVQSTPASFPEQAMLVERAHFDESLGGAFSLRRNREAIESSCPANDLSGW